MATRFKGTIVSFNFNASSSGGDHSISIEAVENAKDLAQEGNSLGTIIGSPAGGISLSDERLEGITSQFKEVRRTKKKDGKTTRILSELTHLTALRLKSHCFVVRGSQSHPTDNSGQVIIPYFSECANSPITDTDQRYPYQGPSRQGGIVRIGNIYNEESSVNSEGVKTSLVYQGGNLKDELSFNIDNTNISAHYKDFPEYSNYDLRFGYTLTEAIQGLNSCGITVRGLPQSNNILFEESGTLDAIISNIASKFGYYWFIDPFDGGVVTFVNSASVSGTRVTNPFNQTEEVQKSYVSASFTEERLSPVIVNAFSSQIEKKQQTFEFDEGGRVTRFKKLSVEKLLDNIKVSEDVLRLYYTMYLAGAYNANNFDVMGIVATKGNKKIKWSKEEWSGAGAITKAKSGSIDIVTTISGHQEVLDSLGPMDVKSAVFIKLKKDLIPIERPSLGEAFSKVELVYRLLNNRIYLSNYYSEYTATRTNWSGSEMSISGPFEIGTNISEIEALADVSTALEEDITLGKLMDSADSKGDKRGGYGFVGILDGGNHSSNGIGEEHLDFGLFNAKNYDFCASYISQFLAVSKDLKSRIEDLADASAKAFNDMDKNGPQTAKAYYSRSKRPTNSPNGVKSREDEERDSARKAGLDAAAQKLSELAERFDIRLYALKTNGASGDPLRPINLDIKNGRIAEILALESSGISSAISNRYPPSQSSRTIVGISIPEKFSPTISGITLQLSDSGVTTTIKESTIKMLRPDEQLIIDTNMKALLSTRNNTAFTAKQKALFGI
ncbi:hypothetical protein N9973_00290 [bacterium]|nr:hypothetical protein [bacterium]